MALSYVARTATAGERDFDISFPYINRSHVQVLVNGNAVPVLEWVTSSRLRLVTPLVGGEHVILQRDTPIDTALVAFQNGNVLTSEDLNIAVLQLLYRQQEMSELYDRTVGAAKQRLAELGGISVDTGDVFDALVQQLLGSTALQHLEASIADITTNAQALLDEIAARQEADQSLVERSDGILAKVEDNTAFVGASERARIDEEESRAASLIAVMATQQKSKAQVLAEIRAVSTDLDAEAARIESVEASLGNTNALVASEQLARASADDALAINIEAVQTELDGAKASITETSLSVDGLLLQHSIKLNANGHITGFVQNNNGITGDFTVVADTFRVVTPGGDYSHTPFQVTADGVRIDGNLVVTGSISTGAIADGALTGFASDVSSGAVVIPADTWTEVASADLQVVGGTVRVDFSTTYWATNGTATLDTAYFRVKRGGQVLTTRILAELNGTFQADVYDDDGVTPVGTAQINMNPRGSTTVFYLDEAAPAGLQTYTVEVMHSTNCSLLEYQMALTEYKK